MGARQRPLYANKGGLALARPAGVGVSCCYARVMRGFGKKVACNREGGRKKKHFFNFAYFQMLFVIL